MEIHWDCEDRRKKKEGAGNCRNLRKVKCDQGSYRRGSRKDPELSHSNSNATEDLWILDFVSTVVVGFVKAVAVAVAAVEFGNDWYWSGKMKDCSSEEWKDLVGNSSNELLNVCFASVYSQRCRMGDKEWMSLSKSIHQNFLFEKTVNWMIHEKYS